MQLSSLATSLQQLLAMNNTAPLGGDGDMVPLGAPNEPMSQQAHNSLYTQLYAQQVSFPG